MRFSYRMVLEVYQVFWAAMAHGEFITDAAIEAGTYRKQGTRSRSSSPAGAGLAAVDICGGVLDTRLQVQAPS